MNNGQQHHRKFSPSKQHLYSSSSSTSIETDQQINTPSSSKRLGLREASLLSNNTSIINSSNHLHQARNRRIPSSSSSSPSTSSHPHLHSKYHTTTSSRIAAATSSTASASPIRKAAATASSRNSRPSFSSSSARTFSEKQDENRNLNHHIYEPGGKSAEGGGGMKALSKKKGGREQQQQQEEVVESNRVASPPATAATTSSCIEPQQQQQQQRESLPLSQEAAAPTAKINRTHLQLVVSPHPPLRMDQIHHPHHHMMMAATPSPCDQHQFVPVDSFDPSSVIKQQLHLYTTPPPHSNRGSGLIGGEGGGDMMIVDDGKTPRSIEIARHDNLILRIPDNTMMVKQQHGLHDMLEDIHQDPRRFTEYIQDKREKQQKQWQQLHSMASPLNLKYLGQGRVISIAAGGGDADSSSGAIVLASSSSPAAAADADAAAADAETKAETSKPGGSRSDSSSSRMVVKNEKKGEKEVTFQDRLLLLLEDELEEEKELVVGQKDEAAAAVSQYQLLRPVGKGRFSYVFQAVRTSDNAPCAIKQVKLSVGNGSSDKSYYVKCHKEVGLLRNLSHPNIVQYLDCFLEEDALLIVLEWAGGGDLKAFIRRHRYPSVAPSSATSPALRSRSTCRDTPPPPSPPPPPSCPIPEHIIWSFFSQCCEAVSHMHAQRILHRDIKPSNVFIRSDGRIKVGDLGLGRYLDTQSVMAFSQVGTPLYMSPEVLRGEGHDFASDIWSLGCLLYEMACLHSPFEEKKLSIDKLFSKIIRGDYPPIPPHHRYSTKLEKMVDQLIQVDPEARPAIKRVASIALLARTRGVDSMEEEEEEEDFTLPIEEEEGEGDVDRTQPLEMRKRGAGGEEGSSYYDPDDEEWEEEETDDDDIIDLGRDGEGAGRQTAAASLSFDDDDFVGLYRGQGGVERGESLTLSLDSLEESIGGRLHIKGGPRKPINERSTSSAAAAAVAAAGRQCGSDNRSYDQHQHPPHLGRFYPSKSMPSLSPRRGTNTKQRHPSFNQSSEATPPTADWQEDKEEEHVGEEEFAYDEGEEVAEEEEIEDSSDENEIILRGQESPQKQALEGPRPPGPLFRAQSFNERRRRDIVAEYRQHPPPPPPASHHQIHHQETAVSPAVNEDKGKEGRRTGSTRDSACPPREAKENDYLPSPPKISRRHSMSGPSLYRYYDGDEEGLEDVIDSLKIDEETSEEGYVYEMRAAARMGRRVEGRNDVIDAFMIDEESSAEQRKEYEQKKKGIGRSGRRERGDTSTTSGGDSIRGKTHAPQQHMMFASKLEAVDEEEGLMLMRRCSDSSNSSRKLAATTAAIAAEELREEGGAVNDEDRQQEDEEEGNEIYFRKPAGNTYHQQQQQQQHPGKEEKEDGEIHLQQSAGSTYGFPLYRSRHNDPSRTSLASTAATSNCNNTSYRRSSGSAIFTAAAGAATSKSSTGHNRCSSIGAVSDDTVINSKGCDRRSGASAMPTDTAAAASSRRRRSSSSVRQPSIAATAAPAGQGGGAGSIGAMSAAAAAGQERRRDDSTTRTGYVNRTTYHRHSLGAIRRLPGHQDSPFQSHSLHSSYDEDEEMVTTSSSVSLSGSTGNITKALLRHRRRRQAHLQSHQRTTTPLGISDDAGRRSSSSSSPSALFPAPSSKSSSSYHQHDPR